jgi:hypothetical protein
MHTLLVTEPVTIIAYLLEFRLSPDNGSYGQISAIYKHEGYGILVEAVDWTFASVETHASIARPNLL